MSPVLEELHATLGVNWDPVTTWRGRPDHIVGATADHKRQKWWSEAMGRQVMTRLLDTSSPRDQARLLDQANGLGTSFMSVPPSEALKTIFHPDTYRLALRWWLGVPLLAADGSKVSCPGCQGDVDPYGDHLLCCPRNNFTARHAAVQETLVSYLVEAGQGVQKEVPIDSAEEGQRLRPADIFIPHWEGGTHVAIDLTICHGWQLAERLREGADPRVTREKARSFLRRREAAKHANYDKACTAEGWTFKAMAMGTWGGLGPEGDRVLRRIVKRAAGWLEGDLRAARQEEIRHGVGVALMRHIWSLLEGKNYL